MPESKFSMQILKEDRVQARKKIAWQLVAYCLCMAGVTGVQSCSEVAFGGVTARALKMELNQRGLSSIAREVELRFLHDVVSEPIGDMSRQLSSGWDMVTRGLRYSVDFKGLTLNATNAGIQIDFAVNDVSLTADAIELSRPFLWWQLKSECRGVDINVSGPDDLALSILVEPFVAAGGHLDARIVGINFGIDPDSYFVRGPDSCSGILGFNNYLRSTISNVLAGASSQVSEIVRRQVAELLPSGISGLDAMLHKSFDLDIGFPGVPISKSLVLSGAPESIEFNDDRIVFVMKSEVSIREEGGFLEHSQKERHAEANGHELRFASIGLNKQVINDALVEVYPGADLEFEISREKFPQIAEFLTREKLSAIWPDLNEITTDEEDLRVFASFGQVPSIEPREAQPGETAAGVDIYIPNAKLIFQIRYDGRWIDYAFLNVHLRIPLVMDMVDGEMEIAFRDVTTVQITGGWADGYQPTVDIVETDLAQVVVKSLFEMLYLEGPLMKLLIPVYDFGGGYVGFSNPRTEYPYFSIDLISAFSSN